MLVYLCQLINICNNAIVVDFYKTYDYFCKHIDKPP